MSAINETNLTVFQPPQETDIPFAVLASLLDGIFGPHDGNNGIAHASHVRDGKELPGWY
jgi:hypothetical protein